MTAFRDSLPNRFNDAVKYSCSFFLSFAPFLPRISNIKPSSSYVPEIKNEREEKKKNSKKRKKKREETRQRGEEKCLFYDMGSSSRTTLNMWLKQNRWESEWEWWKQTEKERHESRKWVNFISPGLLLTIRCNYLIINFFSWTLQSSHIIKCR